MLKTKSVSLALTMALVSGLAFTAPASAQVGLGAATIADATNEGLVSSVGWRGRYYYGGGYYGYRRGYDPGAVAAAGVAGLAAGALIAGAMQPRTPTVRLDPAWVDYCSAKYRSFDPESGTYVGRDGRRRVCQ